MQIRQAEPGDWTSIWPFLQQIVTEQETFTYDPDMDEPTARAMWMVLDAPAHTVVAVDEDDVVLGTANMYPNKPGPGAHVASASFMVDPRHHGRGTGRALGQYVVDWAKAQGYRGIQFNAVVDTNAPAVHLWQSLGFEIIGTVSEGYRSSRHGYVGLHVMYRTV